MNWPFADPPNVAVLTSADIIDHGRLIEYVSHDAEDGAWQFHTRNGAPEEESQARVVALRTVFELDPTIGALSDLPLGWCARRVEKKHGWHRERCRT